MRRFFIAITLLSLSGFCFAQENLPLIVGGRIPSADSPALYQVQVGAFLLARNVVDISDQLRVGGFDPVFENFQQLTRVIVPRIPANEVTAYLERLKKLGIDQVIIREDTSGYTISEKWAIPEPDSRYSSFEFNQDNRFIVLEKKEGRQAPFVHFGEYIMQRPDLIDMIDFGKLRITGRNGDDINFSFAPIDDPGAQTTFAAVKEQPMPRTPETDAFARAWKVVKSNYEGTVGTIMLFSINGTYLVSKPDGSSFTSNWRWKDDSRKEFEYSHNNWRSYGRANVLILRQDLLEFLDPGYFPAQTGYAPANRSWDHELVPININNF